MTIPYNRGLSTIQRFGGRLVLIRAASVYFVDVGQGSSTIILFDDGNAIVIDCGKSADPVIAILEDLHFDRIQAVVLSHWHQDHVGGAPKLVKKFIDRIEGVYFSRDRPTEQVLAQKVLGELRSLSENESRFWMDQLSIQGAAQGRLYPSESGHSCQSEVLYPTPLEAMEQEGQADVNQGSGIIAISTGDHRILIPGDAGRAAFEKLSQRLNGHRLDCDVVAAPHHSGNLSKGSQSYPGFANAFDWFYQTIVAAQHVIVSAGTGNGYSHPIPNHVAAARQTGATIQCTELTNQCAEDAVISSLNKGTCCIDHTPQLAGRHRTLANQSVACAGTIRVDLRDSGVTIHRFAEHQNAIDQHLAHCSPLCRANA